MATKHLSTTTPSALAALFAALAIGSLPIAAWLAFAGVAQ